MTPYADTTFYSQYSNGDIPSGDVENALCKASRHIDTLTYNRIVGRGIDSLTAFQQEIVKECCCDMADFEYDNAEIIQSVLGEYAINGVSIKLGTTNANVYVQDGVVMLADVYHKLSQTGLCCRRLM